MTVVLSCPKYLFCLPSTACRTKSWRAQERVPRYAAVNLYCSVPSCFHVPKPSSSIIMSFFSQLFYTFIQTLVGTQCRFLSSFLAFCTFQAPEVHLWFCLLYK